MPHSSPIHHAGQPTAGARAGLAGRTAPASHTTRASRASHTARADRVSRPLCTGVTALTMLAACAPAPAERATDAATRGEPPTAAVRVGVDVLLAGDLAAIRGKRIGLITNHTGIGIDPATGDTVSTIDRLHRQPELRLVALFSPEHGIRGEAEAGRHVAGGRDRITGLPIHSLYGETRKPTPAMLEGIDVLLFDIQDIGTRYYTYVWTMALAMQAAAERGIPFIVLDRPNPIGGALVQGNVLEPDHASFVGLYPIPMRHGLTAGELARLINREHGIDADLTVIPLEGWRRDLWYDATGLPWTPPSPNMPSLESAAHYPGTCLFEGTNLSVGRGTPIAFQQIGAPWLDHETLARRLNAYRLPGVRFEPTTFTPVAPGDGKYDGVAAHGVRFVLTDRAVYDPTHAAVAALIEIHRLHPDRLTWNAEHFDRLAGTTRLRERISEGASHAQIIAPWAARLDAFRARRGPYLLYR